MQYEPMTWPDSEINHLYDMVNERDARIRALEDQIRALCQKIDECYKYIDYLDPK